MARMPTFTLLLGMTLGLIACGNNGSETTTAPATGSSAAAERIREDLKSAGQGIKNAATEAASEAAPALQHAKEEARESVHDLAQKIADQTATAPATPP